MHLLCPGISMDMLVFMFQLRHATALKGGSLRLPVCTPAMYQRCHMLGTSVHASAAYLHDSVADEHAFSRSCYI